MSVVTYNHVGYISRCLDSVLAQECAVPFEVIVYDDCSSDGTTDIIRQYVARFPTVVRHVLNEQRQGSHGAIAATVFPLCRGQFIAQCEGDDYWIRRDKLERQYEILIRNSFLVATAHANGVRSGADLKFDAPPRRGRIRRGDLIAFLESLPPLALMFRNSPQIPTEWIDRAPFGDTVLKAWLCGQGDAFIDDTFVGAVHLVHSGGVFSGVDLARQLELSTRSCLIAAGMLNAGGQVGLARAASALAVEYAVREAGIWSGHQESPGALMVRAVRSTVLVRKLQRLLGRIWCRSGSSNSISLGGRG